MKMYITDNYIDCTINGGGKIKYLNKNYITAGKAAKYMFLSFALGIITGQFLLRYF